MQRTLMPCDMCDATLDVQVTANRLSVPDGQQFDGCEACGSVPRIRAMRRLLASDFKPRLTTTQQPRRALLISASPIEQQLLAPFCDSVATASLFGEYSGNHVHSNIVDLKEFGDWSFELVHACCVLDFVPEFEQALRSVHRVLAMNGWFSMHDARIRMGRNERTLPPFVKKLRENYTANYYPEGYQQPIVHVGHDWFMQTMSHIGFEVHECSHFDPFSGKTLWWHFCQRIR
jgi:hypothetical protein